MIRNQGAWLKAQHLRQIRRERLLREATCKPESIWDSTHRVEIEAGTDDDTAWARAQEAQVFADHDETFDNQLKEMF